MPINHQQTNYLKILPLGDTGLVVELGQKISLEIHQRVLALSSYLHSCPFIGMIEYVPAFTSVTVFYDPWTVYNHYGKEASPYTMVKALIKEIISNLPAYSTQTSRTVEIPVCYGGKYGEDLEYVAAYNNLTPEEVISIHSNNQYLVYMIGFAPGFPYLGGMSERIATPRKPSPRLSIPPGSVGIGGEQTGIYTIETPGGWQLIGRTPLSIFCPKENPPSLLRAGDIVIFKPISIQEYEEWETAGI